LLCGKKSHFPNLSEIQNEVVLIQKCFILVLYNLQAAGCPLELSCGVFIAEYCSHLNGDMVEQANRLTAIRILHTAVTHTQQNMI